MCFRVVVFQCVLSLHQNMASAAVSEITLVKPVFPSSYSETDLSASLATAQHETYMLWASNQSILRRRLIEEGYPFTVIGNGQPLRQHFVLHIKDSKVIAWPSPCIWGMAKDYYWAVFVEDRAGTWVGREYPEYDPERPEACAADIEELMGGLSTLKSR